MAGEIKNNPIAEANMVEVPEVGGRAKIKEKIRKYFERALLSLMVGAAVVPQEAVAAKAQEFFAGVSLEVDNREQVAVYVLKRKLADTYREIEDWRDYLAQIDVQVNHENKPAILPETLIADLGDGLASSAEKEEFKKSISGAAAKYEVATRVDKSFVASYSNLPASADLVFVGDKLRKILCPDMPESITVNSYLAGLISEEGKTHRACRVYLFDQKLGILFVDKSSIVVDQVAGVNFDAWSEKIAKRVSSLAQVIDAGENIESYERHNLRHDAVNYTEQSAKLEHSLEPVLELSGRPFSESEKSLLSELEDNLVSIKLDFTVADESSGRLVTFYVSPSQLAENGKLHAKHLYQASLCRPDNKTELIYSIADNVYYPFTQGDTIDTGDVKLAIHRLDDKSVLEIGQIEVGNIDYKASGAYQMYDIGDPRDTLRVFDHLNIDSLEQALRQVETLFNYEPGAALKRIIFDRRREVGIGKFVDTDSVTIFADRSALEMDLDLLSLSRHELLHLLDFRLNITGHRQIPPEQSSRLYQFVNFFYRSNLATLERLSEGKLDRFNSKMVPSAGHASDNVREFFASLVNSLFIKSASQVISESEPEFLKWYKTALWQLLFRLTDIPNLDGAAINQKIASRIIVIERQLKNDLPARHIPRRSALSKWPND